MAAILSQPHCVNEICWLVHSLVSTWLLFVLDQTNGQPQGSCPNTTQMHAECFVSAGKQILIELLCLSFLTYIRIVTFDLVTNTFNCSITCANIMKKLHSLHMRVDCLCWYDFAIIRFNLCWIMYINVLVLKSNISKWRSYTLRLNYPFASRGRYQGSQINSVYRWI